MFCLTRFARSAVASVHGVPAIKGTPALLQGKVSRVLTLHLDAPPPFGLARVSLPLRPDLWPSDTTGRKVYPAAAVLLSAAVDGMFDVADKKVLELGSGVHGVVGRTLRQWWPSCSVTLTDTGKGILDTLRTVQNEDCLVQELDWFNSTAVENLDVSPDIVVGTDIIYNPALMHPLVETLSALLSNHNCEVWIAAEERDPQSFASFKNEAALKNLEVEFSRCSLPVWERASAWIKKEGTIGTMTTSVTGELVPEWDRMWILRVTRC